MKENLLMVRDSAKPVGDIVFNGEFSDVVTYTNLSTHFNVTEGNINATAQANKWLSFTIDDKELLISKVAIRNRISYNHLGISNEREFVNGA